MMKVFLALALVGLACAAAPAQPVTINPQASEFNVASTVDSNTITISQVGFLGNPAQFGLFDVLGNLTTGGVVLSTGDVSNIQGQSTNDLNGEDASTDFGVQSGPGIFDEAKIVITFAPNASMVYLRYVFASEEFPEFANSGVNDDCQILLNGQIVSHLDNQGTVVSIDNIANNNEMIFSPNIMKLDAHTRVLVVAAPVVPNADNTLEISVADIGDGMYDSAIFVEFSTFSTTPQFADPQPPSGTPSPVASTPSPVASTPSPVASTPSPVASTPSPVASTPSPVASTPSPVASTPSPVPSTSGPPPVNCVQGDFAGHAAGSSFDQCNIMASVIRDSSISGGKTNTSKISGSVVLDAEVSGSTVIHSGTAGTLFTDSHLKNVNATNFQIDNSVVNGGQYLGGLISGSIILGGYFENVVFLGCTAYSGYTSIHGGPGGPPGFPGPGAPGPIEIHPSCAWANQQPPNVVDPSYTAIHSTCSTAANSDCYTRTDQQPQP